MAVSVRIEDEAFADIRFKALGALIGSDEYRALGLMAHLWRACTQLGTHILKTPLVAQIVDPAHIVEADLGEFCDEGVRIRGTKGRIEWLEEMRKNGEKGGKYGHLGGRPPKTPKGVRRGLSQKPLPAPAPAPVINLSLPSQEGVRESFEKFWTQYPRKQGKAEALRAWEELNPDEAMIAQILSAISSQSKGQQWQRDAGRWIPKPAKWLRDGEWMNETAQPKATMTREELVARVEQQRRERAEKYGPPIKRKDA